MFRVLETWKCRFLFFTNQPAGIVRAATDSDASFNPSSPHVAPESSMIKLRPTTTAIIYIKATQEFLGALFSSVINDPEKDILSSLVESIKSIVEMEMDNPSVPRAARDNVRDLWSEIRRSLKLLYNPDNDAFGTSSLHLVWILRQFLFVSHMGGYIRPAIVVEGVKKRMVEMQRDAEASAPWIKGLLRANAAYDDYVSSHQRRVSCFQGTRQALLEETGQWVAKSKPGIFLLFGLAGIGKSTIAQTIAERADDVGLLGASFFFSRDEAERRTAARFFTTIAFQLSVHDPEFASAIEGVLMTEQGKDVIKRFPLEQLEVLILEPLRKLTLRKVVIVVDALDECDEDVPTVIVGLKKLVRALPSFKVFLTTPSSNWPSTPEVFDFHDIEEKIVDRDVELYLRHKLSLEEVKARARFPNLREPWAASDDEIKSLVRAAGRLFIIASTAVLFILDKTSYPVRRMKLLRSALERDHTPFRFWNNLYTQILRDAVPQGCEDDMVDRYQTVIGSIILTQAPLSISALAKLADVEVNDITTVLGNLQPVILLGSNDIPTVYHKSFPDYIQDPVRCKDEDLRIDPKFHHTRMAIHCLRLLNQCLKQNILDLADPAWLMNNDEALEERGLAEHHVQERIPSELQYACLYFANHFDCAGVEDVSLAHELERFVNERLLNWLEALSWIKKLDFAHHALLTVQKLLKPTSSDLVQLVTDGLRFLWKFYDIIRRSALQAYHSALLLTPTETSLYMRYSKQMSFFRVQGGQKKWDSVITTLSLGTHMIDHVAFSQNSALLACFTRKMEGDGSLMTIHDALAGIPLGRIEGQVLAIATDFSKAVVFEDGSITLYNVEGIIPVATIELRATAVNLALSADGSRLVAALDDGTVGLWDTERCEQIQSFYGWKEVNGIDFSSDGSRIAIASYGDVVKLLDRKSGEIVADLSFPGLALSRLVFSGDGSRLACLADGILKIWSSREGALIGIAEGVGSTMALSTDGSLIATAAGDEKRLQLWSGNDLALLKTLNLDFSITSLAINNDLLGIASSLDNVVVLYDINTHASIAQLPFKDVASLAFSPDCRRLVAGNYRGEVRLWDIPSITPSIFTSQPSTPTRLAFSSDCTRLASGHEDGTIKLWDTSNMAQVVAFSQNSNLLACFTNDEGSHGSMTVYNADSGIALGRIEGRALAIAADFSKAAASKGCSITLYNVKSVTPVSTINLSATAVKLVLSPNGSRLVAGQDDGTTGLWDTETCEQVDSFGGWTENGMAFSSDGSRIAIASCDGVVKLLDGTSGRIVADLSFPELARSTLMFSGDGSRLAYLAEIGFLGGPLKVWNSKNGELIGKANWVGDTMAISTNGSIIVTGYGKRLEFLNGNDLALLKALDLDFRITSLAIQNDSLGITSCFNNLVALYDINKHAIIARLHFDVPKALAFSPDCTRLAARNIYGGMRLWDVRRSQDNAIRLWDTPDMTQLGAHVGHSERVTALAFSVVGVEFASGSKDGIINLWNGKDGTQIGVLECPGDVNAVALSSSTLAAAIKTAITLWDIQTHSTIATLDQQDISILTFSHNQSLLATYTEENQNLTLWDMVSHKPVATSTHRTLRMRFLPDDSKLAIQGWDNSFQLFNLDDHTKTEVFEDLTISQLGLCSNWRGIPVWTERGGVVGLYRHRRKVLNYPNDLGVKVAAMGSSMIALGCEDGRILRIMAL